MLFENPRPSENVRISDELYTFSKKLERVTLLDLRFELRASQVFINGPFSSIRKLAKRLRSRGIVIGIRSSERGIKCDPKILKAIGL